MADSDKNPNQFFASVAKTEAGCWEWTRGKNNQGYGWIFLDGRMVLAHRHAWTLSVGQIPTGKCVLHRCDNRACVRPSHLYLGSKRDNARDRAARNPESWLRGEAHPDAKLTELDVRRIRERLEKGESQASLARSYGVNYRTINVIHLRKTWAHV